MSIIEKMLKQTAVYWAPLSADYQGDPTYAAPVEISCRWEDVRKEFMTAAGETQQSMAVVYTSIDVEVRGVLMLGSLSTSTNEDDPKANEGAYEIARFDKLPTLKATKFLRTAYLGAA